MRILLTGLFFVALCAGAAPVKVIFDTDMANDCDDAGALAVLHALVDQGEAKILAVVTNRKDPANASAAAVDAINTYYGRPDIPIGTDKDGAKTRGGRPSSFAPALRDGFPHDCKPDDRMPDAVEVYRRVLAQAPDRSVVICSVGALSNLEDLLNSKADAVSELSGPDLVAQKVKLTVIMGGGFPRTGMPETNIKLDTAAAVSVVNQWRGEILWQGFEVGAAINNGAELKAAPKTNPVRRAYELRPFRGKSAIDDGKPAHDLAAVLVAVRGAQPDLWSVVTKGRVITDSEGNTEWRRDWAKRHSYLRIKPHHSVLERIIGELLVAPPNLKP